SERRANDRGPALRRSVMTRRRNSATTSAAHAAVRRPMDTELALYIGGEWKNGGGRKGEDVVNPATGKPLARLPHASTADLDAALEAAQKGFEVWRATSAYD